MHRFILLVFLGLFLATNASAFASAKKSTLQTVDGLSFDVMVSQAEAPKATIIYVTGLGGKGNQIQQLSSEFTTNNFNLVTFDRDEIPCSGFKCFATVGGRVPSGQPIYAGSEPSALDHIVSNEIASVIDFVSNSQWHKSASNLFVIGGSYGAWITLQTTVTPELSGAIDGVIFVSPSVAPHKSTGKYANELIRFNEIKGGLKNKPVLAIGSGNDELFPGATTKDSIDFLATNLIGARVQIIVEHSGKHAKKLLLDSSRIRNQIIEWLVEKAR